MNRIKEVLEDKGIKQTWLAEKLVKEYGCPNAEKRKEKKHENTTRYIVHGFLTSATTPYTERYSQ
ncbi:transcriptional regulator [Bacteroidia bacterium]|nr:transcriptional regulator [Bacteroidia bacterium]